MNINFSLGNLNRLAEDYMRRNATVTPAPVAPRPASSPVVTSEPSIFTDTTASNTLQDYRDTLARGADYAAINDVDKVDDFYDTAFMSSFEATPGFSDLDIGGGEFGLASGGVAPARRRNITTGEYFGSVPDAPEYLSTFLEKEPNPQNAIAAYRTIQPLTSSSDIVSALTNHYGYDFTPTNQNISTSKFGGNLGEHFEGSKNQLQEFHSLVEPILQEQIPYIQATQGLEYQDALAAAYNNDPMLQALYAKYNVAPVRQTKDGSTYLYDPFSFSEIRTTEVKDPTALDIGKDIVQAVATAAVLGPILGPISSGIGEGLSALTANIVPANTITAATNAALQGKDPLQAVGLQIGGELLGRLENVRIGSDIEVEQVISNVPSENIIDATITPVTIGDYVPIRSAVDSLLGSSSNIAGIPTPDLFTSPDFNPYLSIANTARTVANREPEDADPITTIDLAALARDSEQQPSPVTPVTQPEFDDITVDTTVEPIEQPTFEEEIAPPVVTRPTIDEDAGGSKSEGSDIIADQLREAIAAEKDPDVKDGLELELSSWLSKGRTEYEKIATGPKPSDYEGETEEEQALLWVAGLRNAYNTTTGDDALDGDGSGNGTGRGAGTGVGEGLGMLAAAGAAAGKPSVTDLVFSDYVKRYEAPELQQRALPLQGYQAPQGLFRGLV